LAGIVTVFAEITGCQGWQTVTAVTAKRHAASWIPQSLISTHVLQIATGDDRPGMAGIVTVFAEITGCQSWQPVTAVIAKRLAASWIP
jgi:hypothetical protein